MFCLSVILLAAGTSYGGYSISRFGKIIQIFTTEIPWAMAPNITGLIDFSLDFEGSCEDYDQLSSFDEDGDFKYHLLKCK